MKKFNKLTLTLFLCILSTPFITAQNFVNGDLNGIVSPNSIPPTGWQNIPYTDVNCLALTPGGDTPDVTDTAGPFAVAGVMGNPFSGSTFVSGLYSGDTNQFWHEGIMQTVSGFTVGESYTIHFHQAVVKQQNALDQSGSWMVFLDNIYIGTTPPTFSAAPYNSTSFIWEAERISFTATATSHLIKFLPADDDTNTLVSPTDTTAALRMGIDSIHFNVPSGINNLQHSKCSSVYPNPANDYATIQFCNEKRESCTLTLYDAQGKIVRTIHNITADRVQVEKADLSEGLYTFRVRSEKGIITSGKLMLE
jgi:hypothetical protein